MGRALGQPSSAHATLDGVIMLEPPASSTHPSALAFHPWFTHPLLCASFFNLSSD